MTRGYKTVLAVLSFLAVSTLGQRDNPCPGQTTCTGARQCEWFNQIKALEETNKNEFNRRVAIARNSVCNKGKQKICCPSPNPEGDPSSPSWIPSMEKDECGVSSETAFIVGGEDTDNGEFPWTVLLGSNGEFGCGGSLINRWYVVTAAHCPEPDMVRVGEWRVVDDTKPDTENGVVFSDQQARFCRRRNRPCRSFIQVDSSRDCEDASGQFVFSAQNGNAVCGPPHQDLKVQSFTPHPQYRVQRVSHNDIALVKVEKPVRLASEGQSNVSPICLPLPGFSIDIGEPGSKIGNAKGVVVGWGRTQTEEDRSETNKVNSVKQMKLEMPLVSNVRCQQKYLEAGVSRGDINTENHLCAGGQDGKDSCNGDSGGPFIYRKNNNSPYLLIGTVSFGTKRCGRGFPAVFTRTTSYINWIRQNLK